VRNSVLVEQGGRFIFGGVVIPIPGMEAASPRSAWSDKLDCGKAMIEGGITAILFAANVTAKSLAISKVRG